MRALLGAALLGAALLGAATAVGAASGGAAATDQGEAFRRAILVENDPAAAEGFLSQDQRRLEGLIGDHALYQRLFQRAAELKDLKELLGGLAEAGAFRAGLAARRECRFCQSPAELKAWAGRHLRALPAARLRELDIALLEWETLSAERRDWLAAQGPGEQIWRGLRISERERRLQAWAARRLDALLRSHPRDLAGAGRLSDELASISDLLVGDLSALAHEHVRKLRLAAEALEDAERRLRGVADPRLREQLAAARGAQDLDTRLSRLSQLFDGLGQDRPALRAAAPARPEQSFDKDSRALLPGLLRGALLRQVRGSWAGDELEAFYARHPLNLRVGPIRENVIAQYSGGPITFNEKFIVEYLRARGSGIAQLGRDSRLLDELAMELSPTFVHEAVHQSQNAWAREQGLDWPYGQYLELEAMQVMALFILEKGRRDPAFARLLAADAPSLLLARESVGLAERLSQNGPEYFRETIKARHYPDVVSLEGAMWTQAVRSEILRDALRRELERRQTLPWRQRVSLYWAGPAAGLTQEQLLEALSKLGTPSLQSTLREKEALLAGQPAVFQKHRDRLAEANRLTAQRLAQLQSKPDPLLTRRMAREPPSPAGRR